MSAVEPIIWVFWTGDNPMPPKRQAALESIRHHSELPVVLITSDCIGDFIPDLPRAYQYLSPTTRSDYLRAWFMHHLGGGYCDIKNVGNSWREAWHHLNDNPTILAAGYPEISPEVVAQVPDLFLRQKLTQHYRKLIGCGAFIFRPGTEFTRLWLEEVEWKMDLLYDDLRSKPASQPRDFDYLPHYTYLMGHIFHPLVLRFSDRISKMLPAPQFTDFE